MLEFRFHGRGGQGVVILGKLVARLYFRTGKHVKEFPKFGVERRGAPVEGYVRVDDEPIDGNFHTVARQRVPPLQRGMQRLLPQRSYVRL